MFQNDEHVERGSWLQSAPALFPIFLWNIFLTTNSNSNFISNNILLWHDSSRNFLVFHRFWMIFNSIFIPVLSRVNIIAKKNRRCGHVPLNPRFLWERTLKIKLKKTIANFIITISPLYVSVRWSTILLYKIPLIHH